MSQNSLEVLFQRPFDPVFTPRDNGKTALDVPESFLVERFKDVGTDLTNRFGGDEVEQRIPIRDISPPDLSFTRPIRRSGGFSLFVKKHKEIAGQLVKLFMDQPDFDSFVAVAAYTKDRVNPYLFQYALAVATAHRPDSKETKVPSVVQVFPDQFVDPGVFRKVREEGTLVAQENRQPVTIPVNFTASDREPEQRVAYFREDIGVNSHHWHWHLVYPGSGERSVVQKDRRGELFYYMHSQIIARYNVERFAANLARVQPLNNLRERIPEGYFPKIIRSTNNRAYPPRASQTTLKDINREETTVEVADLERWRDRIFEAIAQGFVLDTSGQQIALSEERGIDLLGDIIENSDLSVNPQLYGSLHNEGHNSISFVHDPDSRHIEEYGVMGDVTTAMRDPIFYRWHSFIDQVFVRHKLTLPVYTDDQLDFSGVSIQNIQINLSRGNSPPNILLTYWQRSQVDLAAGLDFGPKGNVFAQFTHLQHAPFSYRINVNNNGANRRGTCRIFIAPKVDERGTALPFAQQRVLMIELDKFSVNLTPGSNMIVRRSDDSSVTIPFERTFRAVGQANQPTDANELKRFQFCGCGWPQHMLLPKGKPEGMQFDLFVLISDFTNDTVNQEYNENENCNDAASFCGLRDMLYPDRRAMGYPFDRTHTAATLADFIAPRSNMATGTVEIRFSNTLVNRN
jgi:hypothetical protein